MLTDLFEKRSFAFCLLLYLIAFPLGCDKNRHPIPQDLFLDLAGIEHPSGLQHDSNSDAIERVRYAPLNEIYFNEVRTDTQGTMQLRINLFDDAVYPAFTKPTETSLGGTDIWTGKAQVEGDIRIVFVLRGWEITGEVRTETDIYRITPTKVRPWHAITHLKSHKFPDEGPAVLPPTSLNILERQQDKSFATKLCDSKRPPPPPGKGPRVAIMVLFTAAARQASSNIENDIVLAMTQVDQASGGAWFKVYPLLVHTAEIAFTESGNSESDLKTFASLSHVKDLRTQHKADLVALITESGDSCGIAYTLYPMRPELEAYAYSVTRRICLPNATLAHEIGHNMGMLHDRYVHNGGDAGSFNYGYVNTSTKYRTIMAYADQCTKLGISCNRVLTYSSPGHRKPYGELGIEAGRPNAAHNTETLCRNAGIVQMFRR
ncbi:MAG: zinc-dependent metalloprotease [Nitrospira sp.]|nr:zinc-dependent metalloprotease [Nitrospira sp.]